MRSKTLTLLGAIFLYAAAAKGAPCSYTLTPTSASVPASASSNSFTVTVGSTCAWTATTTNSWIHSTSSGTGNGVVGYTVDANTNTLSRNGALVIGNKTFVVTQAAAPLSLSLVLDNDLTWVTSTNYPWYGTNPPAPSFDGMDSAVCGNTAVADSESWIETTVVGPGKLSFWWKVVSDPPDALEFYISDQFQDTILGEVDWTYRTVDIPAGTQTLRWRYVKDDAFNAFPDKGWLDQVSYTTNAPISIQTAVDTCGLAWTTGGNTNPTYWAGQSNITHDGISAARSGAIHTGQESWMQTEVNGVTNVSFWWKVSSQTNYDYLEFYTNNILARRISGEVNWQSNYFRLASTTNTLKWRFAKTNFNIVSMGLNAGWVDQVAFSRPDVTPPVILYSFTNLALNLNSNCQAILPDLTGTNYILAEDSCSLVSITQSPPAGLMLTGATNLALILTAVDGGGNTASVTNIVSATDTTSPVITVLGANPMTIECGTVYAEAGATALDNCSLASFVTNGTVPQAVGSYTISYRAQDASGNAVTNTRTVNVVDTTAPAITLNGSNQIIIECHGTFVDPGATALDACAGSVPANSSGTVNTTVTGTNTITYAATDGNGNTNQVSRTVIVVDTTPPAIVFSFTNLTLSASSNCQAALPDLTTSNYFVAMDVCSSVTVTQTPASGAFLPLGTNQVTLTAIDVSGNSSRSTNVVIVVDDSAPSLVAPATVFASAAPGQCSATNVVLGNPVVTDNCEVGSVTNNAPALFAIGTNVVTWTATDTHGNSTNVSQFVVITDNELPSISCPGAVNVTADTGQNYASSVNLGSPSTSDNCSVAGVTNDAPAQFPVGTNMVTWKVTDDAGNQNSCVQQVIVAPAPDLPHQITAIVRNGDGTVRVDFLGTPSVSYAVQTSSNLVDWVSVQTNVAAGDGTWTYVDSDTGAQMRFYRSARP
jgi:hypothetical protein